MKSMLTIATCSAAMFLSACADTPKKLYTEHRTVVDREGHEAVSDDGQLLQGTVQVERVRKVSKPIAKAPMKRQPTSAETKVNFDTDVAALNTADREELEEFVEDQIGTGDLKNRVLQVNGYADRRGTDAYNKKLSQRRAENVRAFLLRKGAKPKNVSAVGRGEIDTDDLAGARKVEITTR